MDERQKRYWNRLLAELGEPALSTREIRTVRIHRDGPFKNSHAVVYAHGYRHGSIVDSGYRVKHAPRCYHLPLVDTDIKSLTAHYCEECSQLLFDRQVAYRPVARLIRAKCWRDKRHTKVPWKWQERDESRDIGEFQEYAIRRREFLRFGCARKRLPMEGTLQPEIDQRRREAAYRWELQNPPYRAPHTKVVALRDAGVPIDKIARKLKVSPSTIDNRLREVPETVPAADRLALQVAAGGGYSFSRPTVRYIPIGSTAAIPGELVRPRMWTGVAIERDRLTVSQVSEAERIVVPWPKDELPDKWRTLTFRFQSLYKGRI